MSNVLASVLPETPVVSVDGRELGIVHNLTANLQTGELEALIIDTAAVETVPRALDRTDDGYLRVPVAAVAGIGDQIVVQLSKSE